jgi:hypothetical protein
MTTNLQGQPLARGRVLKITTFPAVGCDSFKQKQFNVCIAEKFISCQGGQPNTNNTAKEVLIMPGWHPNQILGGHRIQRRLGRHRGLLQANA